MAVSKASKPRQLGLFRSQTGAATKRQIQLVPRPRRQSGAGTSIYGGIIDDDDQNSDVQGDKWYGTPGSIGISRKMERDPHVSQSLAVKRAPLQAAMWDFEPVSKDPLDIEAADWCNYNFFELNDFDKFMSHATLYMRDGFSLIEPTDDVRPVPESRFPNHPGRGQGVVLTGFHQIPSWTLRYWHQRKDNPSQLKWITQWITGSDGEMSEDKKISARRLLRFTQGQEGANFAGFSYFRRAYGAWKIKQTLLILDAMAHERHGVGTPAMTLPEEAAEEDFDTAEIILSELRAHQKGYLALPFGYSFKWENADVGTAIGEAIERCNRDIAYNMGAGFMLLGLSGGTGSYALAQSQKGQYEIQLEGDARFIANVVNLGTDGWSLVERLVRLNYGDKPGLPRLVARNMPTRDWSKILPVIHNVTTSGHITPDDGLEDFIRKVLYLPQREPETARALGQGKEIKQDRNPPKPNEEENQ